jgi:hypothetical protein
LINLHETLIPGCPELYCKINDFAAAYRDQLNLNFMSVCDVKKTPQPCNSPISSTATLSFTLKIVVWIFAALSLTAAILFAILYCLERARSSVVYKNSFSEENVNLTEMAKSENLQSISDSYFNY